MLLIKRDKIHVTIIESFRNDDLMKRKLAERSAVIEASEFNIECLRSFLVLLFAKNFLHLRYRGCISDLIWTSFNLFCK